MPIFFKCDDNHEKTTLFAIEYYKRKVYTKDSIYLKRTITLVFIKHEFSIIFQADAKK
jgi:hypothetical protein